MLLNTRRRLAEDDGISLVEMAIVIGLLTVVMVPVFMFMSSLTTSEARISNATTQNTDARLGFERLSRSLREANYPQGRTYTDTALFHTIGATDVRYYSNADNDTIIERTRFYLSGGTLNRTVSLPDCSQTPCQYGTASAPTPLIKNVVNLVPGACGRAAGVTEPMFTYYSKTMGGGAPTLVAPTTDVNAIVDINQVKITVQVQISSKEAQAPCQTLSTVVHLRNWRG